MILKQFKYLLLFLLTFLLGAQTTYAKTELVLLNSKGSFSIEQNQSFKSLEKEVQPNIGFLNEKARFGKSEGSSAGNQLAFNEDLTEDQRSLLNKIELAMGLGNLVGAVNYKSLFKESVNGNLKRLDRPTTQTRVDEIIALQNLQPESFRNTPLIKKSTSKLKGKGYDVSKLANAGSGLLSYPKIRSFLGESIIWRVRKYSGKSPV